MFMKPIGKRLTVLLLAAGVLIFEQAGPLSVQADSLHSDSVQSESASSFSYKLYDSEVEYETELNKQMTNCYKILKGHIQTENTIPIPGIITTTYQDEEKVRTSAYYIPQGLCETEDYILVTAYHDGKFGKPVKESNKGWDGVLYVIDADTHEFLMTFCLPQAYHNGGIACDGENIWFTGNTKDKYLETNKPFVQCMKLERLTELIDEAQDEGEASGSIEESDFSDEIIINNKPSFLECDNGVLWVGTYKDNDPEENCGYAIGYPIRNSSGETPSLDRLNVKRINSIPSSAQGMDIDGDTLYISSSGHGGENWVQSSFITTYDISRLTDKNKLVDLSGKLIKRVEVPKMNEEIVVNDTSVYMVFEAASEKFLEQLPGGMKTDRILAIDKSLWEQGS